MKIDELIVKCLEAQGISLFSLAGRTLSYSMPPKNALTQDRPVVIDCPVDYSANFVLCEKLGGVICLT